MSTCHQCGKEARGNYCAWCGAAVGARHCTACGSPIEPEARFCNACGQPVAPSVSGPRAVAGPAAVSDAAAVVATSGQSRVVWWMGGGALLLVIGVFAYPLVVREPPTPVVPAGGIGAPAGGVAPDISSMTPREAADRLFDRVMRSYEGGNLEDALTFQPMAIAAHERARPLDADGYYHVAILHGVSSEHEAALEAAREGLASNADNLLLLGAAAGAALELGDEEAAKGYYRQMLDVWDAEMAKQLPVYVDHQPSLGPFRQEAEALLGG